MNNPFAQRLHRLGDAIAELAACGRIEHVQVGIANEKTMVTLSGYSPDNISALMTVDMPTGPHFVTRYFRPNNDLGAELVVMYKMHFGGMVEE